MTDSPLFAALSICPPARLSVCLSVFLSVDHSGSLLHNNTRRGDQGWPEGINNEGPLLADEIPRTLSNCLSDRLRMTTSGTNSSFYFKHSDKNRSGSKRGYPTLTTTLIHVVLTAQSCVTKGIKSMYVFIYNSGLEHRAL